MRKKLEIPTIGNVLRLFSTKIDDFAGESKRSYRKAFSSFQLYSIGNYSMTVMLENTVVENWIINNLIQGLSHKTVSFYLDKISSLYSNIAHKLIGGKTTLFKEVKRRLKELDSKVNYHKIITQVTTKLNHIYQESKSEHTQSNILNKISGNFLDSDTNKKESLNFIWGCLALKAGVLPNIVKNILGVVPTRLKLLDLTEATAITETEKLHALNSVKNAAKEETAQWFAMRLRPKVKFETLIERFSQISDTVKLPELFYPNEEIVKKTGKKVIWKGKPVIRDVVFFKTQKKSIFPLFQHIYDIAWCYRTPGGGYGNYAPIPTQAMENFKKTLGLLTPDFEVEAAGEMELRPGDEVIIVTGEYADEPAEILKRAIETEDGNKIYRVSLLNSNGHWDIGIDARFLKKVKK